MKKYLFALLLVCSSYLSAASWLTAGTIPLGVAVNDVSIAYYPKIKKVVATWANNGNNLPYYSVFNGTSWSNAKPLLLTNTIAAASNVTIQSFPFKKIMIAAWGESTSPYSPYYSIFNGTTWSTPLVINPSSPISVEQDISMTYDKRNNRIFAAWSVGGLSFGGNPIYSILDGNLTWSQAQPITMSFNALCQVDLAYNKTDEQIVAAWVNNTGSPSFVNDPYYSVFESTWSPPALIPIAGMGTDVLDQIHLGASINNNQVFAAWGTTNGNNPIYGNTYNGATWNPTAAALTMYGSSGTDFSVSFGVDKTNGDIFNAWQDSLSRAPYYSIYSPASGGQIPFMPSAGVNENVNLAYDQQSFQMIAIWADSIAHTIYFNTYQ